MRRTASRMIMAAVTLVTGLAFLLLAAGSDHAPASAAVGQAGITDAPSQVVVQTMDSCKSGLAGAVYTLSNNRGFSATVGTQGPSSPGGIGVAFPFATTISAPGMSSFQAYWPLTTSTFEYACPLGRVHVY